MGKLGLLFWLLTLWVLEFQPARGQCPDYNLAGCENWSETSAWPDGNVPVDGASLLISNCVILDTNTARLNSVIIGTTGKLIFSPGVNADVTLTSGYVQVMGTLRVGSQRCRYEGKANIVLTAVRDFGTLELHGQKKLSWSKLDTTLEKLTPENGMFFNSDSAPVDRTKDGFILYVVDPSDGSIHYNNVLYTGGDDVALFEADSAELVNALNSAPENFIIAMVSNRNAIHPGNNMTDIILAVESAIKCPRGHSRLREMGPGEAYAMVALKGHPKRTKEIRTDYQDQDGFTTATVSFTMPDANIAVQAVSRLHGENWKQMSRIVGATYDAAVPRVHMAGDVSTWVPGDRVVIASSDYDWTQAEEGVIEPCEVHESDIPCLPNELRINFLHEFMHWGEVNHNVDMRAEVGLISRNVRIIGEIASDFVGEELMFGGQVKVQENFVNVHIEGVELNQMGQHYTSDAFPIFFDVAHDVTDASYTHPAYVRDNSIVNSFRGCVALRATHGLHIANNVAYRHRGNCFFLMEGGEKFNDFEGNLAIGTIKPKEDTSILMPYEAQKTASYFITNPLTRLVNNVAAGGEDAGILYAYPPEPLGDSRSLGLMQREEAFHTPLMEFTGNVAHSNVDSGIHLAMSISDDQELQWNSHYEPKADPLNPEGSEHVQVNMVQITAFKNRWQNLLSSGGFYNFHQCSFSDSSRGIVLLQSSDQSQYVTDSVILGESANIGEPYSYWDPEEDVMISLPRSVPRPWDWDTSIRGLSLTAGPNYFHNVWFNGFTNTATYSMGAIGIMDDNKWASSPQTSFEEISWGFDDGVSTGNRVWDDPVNPDNPEQTGETQTIFRDLDGSVTGMMDSTVVKPYPMLYTDDCVLMDNWNMYACPHRYAKITVWTNSAEDKASTSPVMTRDDLPDDLFHQDWSTSGRFPVVIGQDYSYILSFESHMPAQVTLVGYAIERDLWVRVGVCLPMGAEINLHSWSPNWAPTISDWNQLDSIDDLEAEDIATSYFWDQENGFVFFKLKNDFPRENTFPYDKNECPEDKCPMVRVIITNAVDIDMDVSDCNTRAYGGSSSPYRRTMPPVDSGVGAGASYPFEGIIVLEGDGYGDWSSWTACSATCGGGIQVRSRQCEDETGCAGPSYQILSCNTHLC